MRSQLGSFKAQLTNLDWSALAETGGNLSAGSINLYIQLRNRVGRNLLSPSKTVAYAAGEKIAVEIATSVAQPGEDGWQVIISGEKTGSSSDAVQLATYDLKDLADQVTINALPATIELTEDFHLETDNLVVATVADLPLNAIAGMVREVTDESGKIYVWNETANSWEDYTPPSYFTELGNTRNEGGSDQFLRSDELLIPPLMFDVEVVRVSTTPVRYWLLNEAPEGAGPDIADNINLEISINGATVSDDGRFWGAVFSGLIKFELVGYYRLLSAGLDTGLDGVGVTQAWNFSSNFLTLPNPLSPGYAAVYDIWLEADTSVLAQAGYEAGDVLSIDFDHLGKVGIPQPALSALVGKNIVFGDKEKMIVLPNKWLTGTALIDGFLCLNNTELSGIFNSAPANTSGQSVIIKGSTGGTIRTSEAPAELTSDERVLAVFSTQDGFTNPGEFSDVLTTTSPGGITVTVQHPVNSSLEATIREDYPDKTIAGNIFADWQNLPFRIYLLQGTTLWEQQTLEISASAETQDITITELSDFIDVTNTPPQNAELLFGVDYSLFKPSKPSAVASVGGSLAANTYQVAIRYEYSAPNNIITRLRHDIDGVTVKRLNTTFEEILSVSQLWRDEVITRAQARELPFESRVPNSVWQISDLSNAPFIVDLSLVSADNGRDILRFSEGQGGLRPLRTLLRVRDRTGSLFPGYSTLTIGEGLQATENTLESAIAITLDPDVVPAIVGSVNLVGPSGSLLTGPSGSLLSAP
ncbi:hypothetical protein Xen7305DRAFT_00009060 [Xenococcus sp. PCC 7305]|uniref:hypothetical protein n=1 Tax=Xenococcus sp. PCC 7305 TaxID=102125 RepID=UPI0002ABF3BB|nr:hypothetical protein [Xenococcus sp. PCC 7305]ELS01204.1 hypothetical protein Xen7305DRAFT_00009060 [Xenococcus sp. PCC 7305]